MARTIAVVFGIIYTLVGIIGFIPALGGTFGMAPTALLNIFGINLLHNLVHLIIGIGALASSGSNEKAAPFLRTFGYILILIAIVGFFWKNPFGILPIGGPDVWLHLVTGLIFVWAAMATPKPAAAS
jgi:multisubunit Na+/H+ antiporter MnhG subunit